MICGRTMLSGDTCMGVGKLMGNPGHPGGRRIPRALIKPTVAYNPPLRPWVVGAVRGWGRLPDPQGDPGHAVAPPGALIKPTVAYKPPLRPWVVGAARGWGRLPDPQGDPGHAVAPPGL